jgi:hypothetical protein
MRLNILFHDAICAMTLVTRHTSGRREGDPGAASASGQTISGEMNSDSMSASRSIPEYLLFGAPIEPDDAVLLCVHFQPKSERREESSALRTAERTHD